MQDERSQKELIEAENGRDIDSGQVLMETENGKESPIHLDQAPGQPIENSYESLDLEGKLAFLLDNSNAAKIFEKSVEVRNRPNYVVEVHDTAREIKFEIKEMGYLCKANKLELHEYLGKPKDTQKIWSRKYTDHIPKVQ